MCEKLKNIITISLVAFILFASSFAFLVIKDNEFSNSERRKLSQMPELNYENISSGKFMTDFRNYVSDQFPFRDSLRFLKAFSNEKIFLMKDNNGYYRFNNHITEIEYPLNSDSLDRAASVFCEIYERDLKDKNTNIYLSIIPDKNYFLGPKSGHPTLNYSLLTSSITSKMDFAKYIDIFGLIDESCYYYSDIHIRQETAVDIANKLCNEMNAKAESIYTENTAISPFYGVYYGHSALNSSADTLKYLTNDTIDNAKVYDFESQEYLGIYNNDALSSADAYSFFLHGSKSLLRIENPKADTEKKLIIFRDSFASSIAPLMLSGYSEITLVDIRYMSASMVSNFVDFSDSDVLFLYSTPTLNSSITLKK